ncbi:MAG: SDR family oxidoreductase [Chloroflexi bacterium]|nr:SDR family oxidoreductase [Chloroflexota bacterium]
MDPRGRVALVTGAGRRVGHAIALALGGAGANVAVHFNTAREAANETVSAIRKAGSGAELFQADLRDDAALDGLIPAVISRFGRLEILINSASVFRDIPLFETTRAEWDENFAVNVRAPFLLSQAMARSLDGKPGKIINLNDWKNARPKRFAYGVSKSALSGLTRSMALALAPNIQVNEVALGAILLPPGSPPGYEHVLARRTPAKRMGTLEEIAGTMLWLIQNDYVTGETVRVDGGQHLSRV